MRSSPQDIVHAGFQPLEKKFEKKTPQPPQLTVSNDEAVGNGSRQAEWIASEEGPRASPLKSPSENLLSKKKRSTRREKQLLMPLRFQRAPLVREKLLVDLL